MKHKIFIDSKFRIQSSSESIKWLEEVFQSGQPILDDIVVEFSDERRPSDFRVISSHLDLNFIKKHSQCIKNVIIVLSINQDYQYLKVYLPWLQQVKKLEIKTCHMIWKHKNLDRLSELTSVLQTLPTDPLTHLAIELTAYSKDSVTVLQLKQEEQAVRRFILWMQSLSNVYHLSINLFVPNPFFNDEVIKMIVQNRILRVVDLKLYDPLLHLPTIADIFSNHDIEELSISLTGSIRPKFLQKIDVYHDITKTSYIREHGSVEDSLTNFFSKIRHNVGLKSLSLDFSLVDILTLSGRVYTKWSSKNPMLPLSYNRTLQSFRYTPFDQRLGNYDWFDFVNHFTRGCLSSFVFEEPMQERSGIDIPLVNEIGGNITQWNRKAIEKKRQILRDIFPLPKVNGKKAPQVIAEHLEKKVKQSELNTMPAVKVMQFDHLLLLTILSTHAKNYQKTNQSYPYIYVLYAGVLCQHIAPMADVSIHIISYLNQYDLHTLWGVSGGLFRHYRRTYGTQIVSETAETALKSCFKSLT